MEFAPFALRRHSSAIISKKAQLETDSETAVPKPILGWAYLECVMVHATMVSVDDSVRQLISRFNRSLDRSCGIVKLSRRYCRFETSTRYVPTNTGSILRSLEDDVGALQEQPMNCKQVN